jgi:hypothetical protein
VGFIHEKIGSSMGFNMTLSTNMGYSYNQILLINNCALDRVETCERNFQPFYETLMGVNGFLHGNVIDGVVGAKLLPLKR